MSEGVETRVHASPEILTMLRSVRDNPCVDHPLKTRVRIALTPRSEDVHTIAYDVLEEAHRFKTFFHRGDQQLDLRALVKSSPKVYVETIAEPQRSPELQARLAKLGHEQDQREYDALVRNVKPKDKLNFGKDLGGAVRSTGKQFMSIVNFLLSVVASFAFAYFASKHAFGDIALQLIFSILVAVIVALAELYFMARIEI